MNSQKKLLFFTLIVCCIATVNACKNKANKEYEAINLQNFDSTISPGNDFFHYVNGNWIKNHPVPDDKTSYSAFDEVDDNNKERIKKLIDEIVADVSAAKGSNRQQVRDFFMSGMDTIAIEKKGIAPITKMFEEVDAITNPEQLVKYFAKMQIIGANNTFYFYASPDQKNSNTVIANVWQDGLGLPEMDYYLNKDAYFQQIREAYIKHITNIFTILKISDPEKQAKKAYEVEMQLAKISMPLLERRDPLKVYNKFKVDDLRKIMPNFNWNLFLSEIGYAKIDEINIGQVDFMKGFDKMLTSVSIIDWQIYLKWKLINSYGRYLNQDLVTESFNFYGTVLSGQKTQRPRWKRIQSVVDNALGEVIGQLYVEKYFPPQAKERMVSLTQNLRLSFKERLQQLTWMQDSTKQEAIAKLEKIRIKIGYPDKWRDYSKLTVLPDSYFDNVIASNIFEFHHNMQKIGKPVDKEEWHMTPQTVNAYYSSTLNEIVFPAAILQPPFFDMNADDAINYGAIGVVIGHEMTHGFDNRGRLFDKDGNMRDWWTAQDAEEFKKRTQILIDHFDNFILLDSLHVNGKLTIGENIADLCGLTVSLNAYKNTLKGKPEPTRLQGLTHWQRFFISYAQVWRTNMLDKQLIRQIKEDEHPPAITRVNGPLFNLKEFYEAFPQISEKDKLYRAPDTRPVIW